MWTLEYFISLYYSLVELQRPVLQNVVCVFLCVCLGVSEKESIKVKESGVHSLLKTKTQHKSENYVNIVYHRWNSLQNKEN